MSQRLASPPAGAKAAAEGSSGPRPPTHWGPSGVERGLPDLGQAGRAAAGHTPDCGEAEVCMSQREPESGTDKDRFIVGSKFWSPPLGRKH